MSLVPTTHDMPAVDVFVLYGQMAEKLANTEFVPETLRKRPEAVLACLLYGKELGLGPMQSLSSINVIKGKVGLAPETMRALVLTAGHELWIESQSDSEVVIAGRRRGAPPEQITHVRWTLEDARRAGLQGDNWKKYPRAMLLARATSELCRAVFPDVIAGLSYTPEEIESIPAASWDAPSDIKGKEVTNEASGVGDIPDRDNGSSVVKEQGSSGATESTAPAPTVPSARSSAIKERADALSAEFKEIARAAWKKEIGVAPYELTEAKAVEAEKLLDKIEKQQADTWARRQRNAWKHLTAAGFRDGTDVEKEQYRKFVAEACGEPEVSTTTLTEAQLAAVVDACKPLVEALADPGPEAA